MANIEAAKTESKAPMSSTKKLLLSVFILLLATVAIFISCEVVYADQIIPGVSIAGQRYSGDNPAVIRKALEDQFGQYIKSGLTLKTTDKSYKLDLANSGITFDYDKAVAIALEYSHGKYFGIGAWHTFTSIFLKNHNVTVPVAIDQQKLKTITDDVIHDQFTVPPTDATLNITDSTVDVLNDKDGLWVDDQSLWTVMETAVSQKLSSAVVPMIVKPADIKPADLSTAKADAEKLLANKITLTANSKKILPSRADIKDWIIVKSDSTGGLRAGVDTEKIKAYLTNIVGPQVNKKTVNQILSTDGSELQSGSDGTSLNIDASTTNVVDAINKGTVNPIIALAVVIKNRTTSTVDPTTGGTPSMAEGKYIEVNLTLQKMYLWIGAQFVNSFGVSTGKWSTPTPIGTFSIHNKISTAYSTPYDLYMPYWNAITADGQYGIHGLPYRGSWIEGANHIGTPVSHGCIRLGPGNDSFVYGWADIGTPVFIHK